MNLEKLTSGTFICLLIAVSIMIMTLLRSSSSELEDAVKQEENRALENLINHRRSYETANTVGDREEACRQATYAASYAIVTHDVQLAQNNHDLKVQACQ